jgi:hypothetical protein
MGHLTEQVGTASDDSGEEPVAAVADSVGATVERCHLSGVRFQASAEQVQEVPEGRRSDGWLVVLEE